jgi:bacteriocin leader peptide (microcyclamide/patellamide family)
MDKKNLMPQASQPISRTNAAQRPDVLAELEELDEEALSQVCGGAGRRTPVVKGKPPTVPSSGR